MMEGTAEELKRMSEWYSGGLGGKFTSKGRKKRAELISREQI